MKHEDPELGQRHDLTSKLSQRLLYHFRTLLELKLLKVNRGARPKGNDSFPIKQGFEFLLPFLRVVVLEFLIWDSVPVLLDFLGLQELLVHQLELLQDPCTGDLGRLETEVGLAEDSNSLSGRVVTFLGGANSRLRRLIQLVPLSKVRYLTHRFPLL